MLIFILKLVILMYRVMCTTLSLYFLPWSRLHTGKCVWLTMFFSSLFTDPDLQVQVIMSPTGPKLICHSSCLTDRFPFVWYENEKIVPDETFPSYGGHVDPEYRYSCASQGHRSHSVCDFTSLCHYKMSNNIIKVSTCLPVLFVMWCVWAPEKIFQCGPVRTKNSQEELNITLRFIRLMETQCMLVWFWICWTCETATVCKQDYMINFISWWYQSYVYRLLCCHEMVKNNQLFQI